MKKETKGLIGGVVTVVFGILMADLLRNGVIEQNLPLVIVIAVLYVALLLYCEYLIFARPVVKPVQAGWGSNIFGLLMAVLLAFGIRIFAYEPYNIPSGSMFPTLLIGDHLFISKFSYGYSRHSFPFSLPVIPHGRIFEKMPKIGDVAVFRVTPEMIPNLQMSVDYIKRVVALPGDTIQMKQGRLYINGVMAEREFVKKEEIEIEGKKVVYSRYVETLPNGVKHDIYEVDDMVAMDDTPLITVPEGHFFAMGDNRDNSYDSRFFGAVPLTHLEGKAEFIFYSNNGKGFFFEFWRWPEFVRTERIFNKIK